LSILSSKIEQNDGFVRERHLASFQKVAELYGQGSEV